jgi:hypothetical protein
MMPEWTDRNRLYRIDDGEGDPLFVVAETFAEALEKFVKWDNGDQTDYESIAFMGHLINETRKRQ